MAWTAAALFAYFGARLAFFALSISPDVPPDEATHVGLCRVFAQSLRLPDNSQSTYALGLVTNVPYLYYWLMGRLLAMNVFGVPDLLYLRFANLPLAFGTVVFAWRTLRLLTLERPAQLLLLAVMTNTLMFSFLSASVSYDNLANLLAAMAVYHLFAFLTGVSRGGLAASALCQMAGCLTKSAFLPLALILNLSLLARERGRLRSLPRALFPATPGPRRRLLLPAGALLLGLLLNLQLYGGNLVRYGMLHPAPADVLPPERAMQYRIAARDRIFSLFREGAVSREEARALALRIPHAGDRAAALHLIDNYAAFRSSGARLLGPLPYLGFWVRQMAAGTFGIAGHLPMLNYGPTVWVMAALAALAGAGFLLRRPPPGASWLSAHLAAIAAVYALVLAYPYGYRNYLYFASAVLGVSGRNLFPVLGPVAVLFSRYLASLPAGPRARAVLAVVVSALFVAGDLPWFLLHATPEWYAPPRP